MWNRSAQDETRQPRNLVVFRTTAATQSVIRSGARATASVTYTGQSETLLPIEASKYLASIAQQRTSRDASQQGCKEESAAHHAQQLLHVVLGGGGLVLSANNPRQQRRKRTRVRATTPERNTTRKEREPKFTHHNFGARFVVSSLRVCPGPKHQERLAPLCTFQNAANDL